MTPIFFYAIGGYLVIQGQLTLGALVAALSAYKDLVSPWKELLNFYNQFMDSSIRYDAIIEKFDPEDLIDADRQAVFPEPLPRLDGDIELHNVSWGDDVVRVLRNVSMTIEGGSAVAIVGPTMLGVICDRPRTATARAAKSTTFMQYAAWAAARAVLKHLRRYPVAWDATTGPLLRGRPCSR